MQSLQGTVYTDLKLIPVQTGTEQFPPGWAGHGEVSKVCVLFLCPGSTDLSSVQVTEDHTCLRAYVISLMQNCLRL